MIASGRSFAKEGTLFKKGMGQIYRPWVKRLFRLDVDYSLGYYHKNKMRGAINIIGCTLNVLRASEADGKCFAFAVENPLVLVSGSSVFKSHDLILAADNLEEAAQWGASLLVAIKMSADPQGFRNSAPPRGSLADNAKRVSASGGLLASVAIEARSSVPRESGGGVYSAYSNPASESATSSSVPASEPRQSTASVTRIQSVNRDSSRAAISSAPATLADDESIESTASLQSASRHAPSAAAVTASKSSSDHSSRADKPAESRPATVAASVSVGLPVSPPTAAAAPAPPVRAPSVILEQNRSRASQVALKLVFAGGECSLNICCLRCLPGFNACDCYLQFK